MRVRFSGAESQLCSRVRLLRLLQMGTVLHSIPSSSPPFHSRRRRGRRRKVGSSRFSIPPFRWRGSRAQRHWRAINAFSLISFRMIIFFIPHSTPLRNAKRFVARYQTPLGNCTRSARIVYVEVHDIARVIVSSIQWSLSIEGNALGPHELKLPNTCTLEL